MCFDRGPKDSQIQTVRPDSFNCFSSGFSWLKIWWPNTTKGADGCDGIPVIFGVPDLTPTIKGLQFFGNFDLISKVFGCVVNILCGTSYILPSSEGGNLPVISGVMGPPKKPCKDRPCLWTPKFRVPTTPPQGIRRFSWMRGPPWRVVSLTGGFKSPRPNGWKWPRTRGSYDLGEG